MWLLSSDLHLTDHPKDEYRFGIFKWLAKQQAKYKPEITFVLGDLTQNKDNHSSKLVNRIIDELTDLQPPIYILRGNHDGIDPGSPFFKFLNCIEGVNFISEPEVIGIDNENWGMIPHCRTQQEFDEACSKMPEGLKALMIHQTIAGAIAETNRPLTGFKGAPIEALCAGKVYAGDVHKPQQCGPVTYIGSPYQIRFGDDFKPRVLLTDCIKEQNLHFPCIQKWSLTIRDVKELEKFPIKAKDQVKILMELPREEILDWPIHKKDIIDYCNSLGVVLFGPEVDIKSRAKLKHESKKVRSIDDIFSEYCLSENVSTEIKQAGKTLLEE